MVTHTRIAQWQEDEAARLRLRQEAIAKLAEIVAMFPDMVVACAKAIDCDPRQPSPFDVASRSVDSRTSAPQLGNRSGGREIERSRKRDVILEAMRQFGSPMTYQELEAATSLTRSALRNTIESVFPADFKLSHNPQDRRTMLWSPVVTESDSDEVSDMDGYCISDIETPIAASS